MSYSIILKNLSLILPHKTCFEDFSAVVPYGSKIAVIGDNGAGKSTLLKALAGEKTPLEGEIVTPPGLTLAYVPQTAADCPHLSGAQRFHKKLTEALSLRPDVLLLDEPTNHLDEPNRRALMNQLKYFAGTLFVVSHDTELLRNHTDVLWHIAEGEIRTFSGSYDEYRTRYNLLRTRLQNEKYALEREKQHLHQKRMQNQERAAHSRQKGEKSRQQAKWAPIVAGSKENQAQASAGKKAGELAARAEKLRGELAQLYIAEELQPSFWLPAQTDSRSVLFVSGASAGYPGKTILTEVSLSVGPAGRVALTGANASGKSTFLRALVRDPEVQTSGVWEIPPRQDIGYLDQHYAGPDETDTVLSYIQKHAPGRTHAELRKHLNGFLFRKQEEINAPVRQLSGGERARLALAAVACRVPKLLVLDEITNNLDLRTKEYVAQILRAYPGAFLIVSHEADFLREINVTDFYTVENGTVKHRK